MHKLYLILNDFSTQMKKQNISAFAASTAFFLFLSFVPMLIVLCTIIPFTPLTEADITGLITDVTPDTLDTLIESMIDSVFEKSAGVMSVAILTTIWSAGKGVMALIQGLNAINDVDENRNYFHLRFVASFYTVIMLVSILLSMLIVIFSNQLIGIAERRLPHFTQIHSVSMHLRVIITWAVITLLICVIYSYVPNQKLRFREQIPGAALSAVAWSVFSWGFSVYVSFSKSFSIYGSISLIIMVMIWLYFCMYIIMVGAYINRYFRPINRVLVRLNVREGTRTR
ncbi:MAG: YihY/virulence factor BrkB family protein [Acetatifactor sp.]|nr:YihY/virulence factor BrkB family protein [Acetatifactor sp.]